MWQPETKTTFDLSMFSENSFLHTYSITLLGKTKIVYRKKVFEINCWEKINSKLSSVKRINSDKKQKFGEKIENYDTQEQLNFLLKKVEWQKIIKSSKRTKIVMFYKKSSFHWNSKRAKIFKS